MIKKIFYFIFSFIFLILAYNFITTALTLTSWMLFAFLLFICYIYEDLSDELDFDDYKRNNPF